MLLSFYGDDFTGSTDVMESLARAGVPAALFLDPPTTEQLARFPAIEAVGVAGVGRSLSPAEMDDVLPPIFVRLRELGAPIVHYKVCSTFDSSPEIGSIGHAIDVGQQIFASPFVPLVVGAPILGRYCVFGNLFARSGAESEVFRLDRHPTMRRHPITPMHESDLRLHLARQTSCKSGLLDVLHIVLPHEEARGRLEALLRSGAEIVLFDVMTDEQLSAIGRLIWERASREEPLFAAGSSGLEYALTAHWRAAGMLPAPPVFAAEKVEQIVVVSGSCSPVTEGQIAWAVEHGFAEIALQPEKFVNRADSGAYREQTVEVTLEHISQGRSVILHTSRGPQDARIDATRRQLREHAPGASTAKMLGEAMGEILRCIVEQSRLRRVAVTGGDTSGYVARAMGIEALEMAAPMAPGSPLCHAHSANPAVNGLEIIFKGGQVGKVDLFGGVLRGAPESS